MILNTWATILFCSSFVILISFGIADLVQYFNNPTICGAGGITGISMTDWIYGCGVSYIPLSVLYALAFIIDIIFDFSFLPLFIFIIGTIFTTVWTIIGGITLFTVGIRCMTYNYIIWQMGLSTVITFIVYIPLSIVLFLLAFYTA